MDTRIPPPLVALALIALVWWADRALPGMRLAFAGQGAVAALFAALGVACALAGVLALRSAGTTVSPFDPDRSTQLVVAGIYTRTRNPMYLGLLLAITGFVVWRGQPLGLLALPALVLFITRFQIRPEEAALHRRFGAVFAAYCQRVRRWL